MSDETTTPEAPVEEAAPTPETPPAPVPLPQVTSPAEWRRRRQARFLLTLPSGAVVTGRRPDWIKLAKDGVVDLEEMTKLGGSTNREQLARVVEMFPAIMPHIIVEPRCGPDDSTEEDVLRPADVMYVDRLALFQWATGTGSSVVEQEVPMQ